MSPRLVKTLAISYNLRTFARKKAIEINMIEFNINAIVQDNGVFKTSGGKIKMYPMTLGGWDWADLFL